MRSRIPCVSRRAWLAGAPMETDMAVRYKLSCTVDKQNVQTVMDVLEGVAQQFLLTPVILDKAGNGALAPMPLAPLPRKGIQKNCLHCGRLFIARTSGRGQKYCTKECAGASHNWSGQRRRRGFVNKLAKTATEHVFTIMRSEDRAWVAPEMTRRLASMGYGKSTGPSIMTRSARVGLAVIGYNEKKRCNEYTLTESGRTLPIEECAARIADHVAASRVSAVVS